MIDYYYVIDGREEPDIENMIVCLLDNGVLFATEGKLSTGEPCCALCVNVNDWFVPGSDAESVGLNEVAELFESYRAKSFNGAAEFVAKKRGISPLHWREEGSDFHSRLNLKS